jgi:hypothetical protein
VFERGDQATGCSQTILGHKPLMSHSMLKRASMCLTASSSLASRDSPLGCAWHEACYLGCMGSYFVGGRRSCPMFNARPFAIQFTHHELRIFAEMQLFSAVPLPGKHANTIADLSIM